MHKISGKFKLRRDWTTDYGVCCPWASKKLPIDLITGKWCLHASSFIFYQIIRKVAGNQDRHKSSVEFYFGPDQTTHFGVTCPWVTKISHSWTWISLKPVGQSWSDFMCSIIGVGCPSVCLSGQTFRVYGVFFWSKIRFIPLKIHWVALKPIFCLRFRGYFSMGVLTWR